MKNAKAGERARKDVDLHQMTIKIPEAQYSDLMKLATKHDTTPTAFVKELILTALSIDRKSET